MTDKKSHREVVVFASEAVSKTLTQEYEVASLRSQQRRKRPSGCLGPSALAMMGEGVTAGS